MSLMVVDIITSICWERIHKAYAEPHRAYHNMDHIKEMFELCEAFAANVGWHQPGEVHLAITYHDVIYVPGDPMNEINSARAMMEDLRDIDPPHLENIFKLIMLTHFHGSFEPGQLDHDAAHFLDIDMARLGAAPDHFDQTNAGIDFEFQHVPRDKYLEGRRKFFEKLQALKYIYLTPYFREKFEQQARSNIERTLEKLKQMK